MELLKEIHPNIGHVTSARINPKDIKTISDLYLPGLGSE